MERAYWSPNLVVKRWRFSDMRLPPSSISVESTKDASNDSKISSLRMASLAMVDAGAGENEGRSMFQRRIVLSAEPEARTRPSSVSPTGLNAKPLTQSSCPGSDKARTHCRYSYYSCRATTRESQLTLPSVPVQTSITLFVPPTANINAEVYNEFVGLVKNLVHPPADPGSSATANDMGSLFRKPNDCSSRKESITWFGKSIGIMQRTTHLEWSQMPGSRP
jgi:hypothetical protein